MRLAIVLFFISQILLPLNAQVPEGLEEPQAWLIYSGDETHEAFKDLVTGEILHSRATAESLALNHHPCYAFHRETKGILSLDFLPQTVIFVSASPAQTEQLIWSIHVDDTLRSALTTRRLADLFSYQYINYPPRVFQQPLLSTWVANSQNTEGKKHHLTLGNTGSSTLPVNAFEGTIAEVLVYNRVLSEKAKNIVESYLALKYGITLISQSAPQYVGGNGQLLWDGLREPEFNFRIAGIGKDEITGFAQKISTSSVDPGLLSIEAENDIQQFSDGNYLLWGSTNQPLILEKNEGDIHYFSMQWKVEAQHWPREFTTRLSFNKKAINTSLNTGEHFWLAISAGKADLKFEGEKQFIKGIVVEDKVQFKEINWDRDLSGSDYFQLLIGPSFFADISIRTAKCGAKSGSQLNFTPVGGTPPFTYRIYQDQTTIHSGSLGGQKLTAVKDLSPGFYSLRLTDALGEAWTHSFQISQGQLTESHLPAEMVLPGEGAMEFTLDGAEFEEVKWMVPGGTIVMNKTIEITQPGMYRVLAKINNCIFSGEMQVSTSKSSFITRFTLYPNPTSTGKFHLSIALAEAEDIRIELHSPSGQLLQARELQGRDNYKFEGQIPGPPGAYVLTLKCNNEVQSRTLIYR